jgi:hypothetical protein
MLVRLLSHAPYALLLDRFTPVSPLAAAQLLCGPRRVLLAAAAVGC